MDIKLAKKLLKNISYSQKRNQLSNRPVRKISLTEQDLIDLFRKQRGKCYWSKLPLDGECNYITHHPFAISPERLDNSLGYTKSNTVLCRRIFNLGRMSYSAADFKLTMKTLKKEIKGTNKK
jgi:hypothetical protein